MIRTLSSCCYTADDSTFGEVLFSFEDNTPIEKIELVGVGKTIPFQSTGARVTLNPQDTICSYRIFYNGGEGMVTLAYNPTIKYANKACGDEMQVSYVVKVKATTFREASINNNYSKILYVKISL